MTFLDLNADVIGHELEREGTTRRTGPTAEAILLARRIPDHAQLERLALLDEGVADFVG